MGETITIADPCEWTWNIKYRGLPRVRSCPRSKLPNSPYCEFHQPIVEVTFDG